MIQRIQTVYLLIAGLLSGVFIFVFSLWTDLQTEKFVLDLFKGASILEKIVPALFFGSALLSIVTIFKFKNRKLQFVLGRVNILINFLLLGVLIYLSLTLSGETLVSEKGIGMFIPIVTVVLLVLANKAIKKDEDLVKSADRLR